jgi:membrane-bound lytic murein transglycosylase B
VPWQYLAAVNFVETKFGRIRGTSIAGAQGPMQFLPSNWKQYGKGGDINSDRDAIAAAARFLQARTLEIGGSACLRHARAPNSGERYAKPIAKTDGPN